MITQNLISDKILKKAINLHLLIFVLIIILAMIITMKRLSAMDDNPIREKKGLYSYSIKDFSRFLKKAGFANYSFKAPNDVSKSLDGNEIWFYNWSSNKVVFVTCAGIKKEIDLPGKRTWSKRSVWFNKEHQVVAWIDKGKVRYSAGVKDDPLIMSTVVNPCGGYFVKNVSQKGVEIYSIEKPDSPLAKVNVLGTGVLKLFFKKDMVYLFDYDSKDGPLKAHIFKKQGMRLVQKDLVIIPRPKNSPAPFYVEDISAWDDNVLLTYVHDWPSKSKWYLFNLKTQEIKIIGNANNYGFYLSCDIIKQNLVKEVVNLDIP